MAITFEVAKAIYREAIDPRVGDGEGAAWWDAVASEMKDVVAARTLNEAAGIMHGGITTGTVSPTP
ncbi:hypothetical protein [Caballeronia sp. LZ001]|uniref:hypothetical protein n=1 Tax=Caballeronia sp. LZ001 TaxID=3038553 RepID=UPI002857A4BF|nr:hypothetical protein [Caballeronia sp. LZ001]MDR5804916.1 hypothetical protein [Caballeronia sp. LZ001]